MSARVLEADCIEAMRELDEASVDAIVTDPPYGLEFMGKEWDRFAGRAVGATERADHMNRSKSYGPWGRRDRPIMPNDYGRRNERCLKCGKWRVSSNRCTCANPEWEYRTRDEAPPAMRAFQEWTREWAHEAKRVLKPGGHLLAFGGTRTYHRLACAIEDAGFEIRDSLMWLYASGFPKSLDVSKAIDKAAGAEREVVGVKADPRYQYPRERSVFAVDRGGHETGTAGLGHGEDSPAAQITAPATPEAAKWQGWGTALKPAYEPIVVARKPLIGTVAENVQQYGTGALNIDGCRIEGEPWKAHRATGLGSVKFFTEGETPEIDKQPHDGGRWPANVALDPEAAAMLDEQSGYSRSRAGRPRTGANGDGWGMRATGAEYDDEGGASRFFYCAKASRGERNAGLDGFEERKPHDNRYADGRVWDIPGSHSTARANHHPTVKPIELMRWLVRLVTPPGGLVLDPFAGSGTTGCAAVLEGFDFIGIEREPDYAAIARARIEFWSEYEGQDVEAVLAAEARARKLRESGQETLL